MPTLTPAHGSKFPARTVQTRACAQAHSGATKNRIAQPMPAVPRRGSTVSNKSPQMSYLMSASRRSRLTFGPGPSAKGALRTDRERGALAPAVGGWLRQAARRWTVPAGTRIAGAASTAPQPGPCVQCVDMPLSSSAKVQSVGASLFAPGQIPV